IILPVSPPTLPAWNDRVVAAEQFIYFLTRHILYHTSFIQIFRFRTKNAVFRNYTITFIGYILIYNFILKRIYQFSLSTKTLPSPHNSGYTSGQKFPDKGMVYF